MLKTVEEKQRFLASEEMMYDPMYQPSMDSMYHHWLQPKYIELFKRLHTKPLDIDQRISYHVFSQD